MPYLGSGRLKLGVEIVTGLLCAGKSVFEIGDALLEFGNLGGELGGFLGLGIEGALEIAPVGGEGIVGIRTEKDVCRRRGDEADGNTELRKMKSYVLVGFKLLVGLEELLPGCLLRIEALLEGVGLAGSVAAAGVEGLLLGLGTEGVEEEGRVEDHGALVRSSLHHLGDVEELGDVHVLLGKVESLLETHLRRLLYICHVSGEVVSSNQQCYSANITTHINHGDVHKRNMRT